MDLGIQVSAGNLTARLASILARDVKASGSESKTLSIPVSVDLTKYDAPVPFLIAKLVDKIVKGQPVTPGTSLIAGGLFLGSDEAHKISLLSKVVLIIDISKLLESSKTAPKIDPLSLPIKISSVTGGLGDDLVLGIDVALAITEKILPFPVNLDIGFARLDVYIGKVSTGQASLSKIKLDSAMNAGVHLSIFFKNTAVVSQAFLVFLL